MSDMISVIVPTYNVESTIIRTLDSILAQTYSEIEVIVVDDGSTDRTGEVIDDYAAQHGRIVSIHTENYGVTAARLTGIARASGEWIGFVDGDDEIEPDMYERLFNNAQKYNAQISHCGYQMQFSDGRIHYFYNTGLLVKQDKTTALRELLSGSRIEPGLCNKLFHKNLFHSLPHGENVDTSIKINEDMLMNFYLFSAAETTVFEDWCPYHYIVREGSASRSKLNENKIYDPIKVKRTILFAVEDELKIDAKRAYINTCINAYHILLFAGAEYRKDLQKIRKLLKKEQNSFFLLGTKRALMAWMITWAPILYKPIYGIYFKCFQENIYS